MSEKRTADPRAVTASEAMAALRREYGCGPIELAGTAGALYERPLLFDNVADPAVAGARERYEALARSVRDVLPQRWVRTEQTYESPNVASSGKFSSDRTIAEYAADIWHARPCPVS